MWLAALGALVLAAVSVGFVKYLDEDNRFCIACHLHESHYRAAVDPHPATLAAAHYRAKPGRKQIAMHPERCFTCHSGEGVRGWSAVTALSAWDATRWVLGDRHEPTSMRLPVENRACIKCHADDIRPHPRNAATSVGGSAAASGESTAEHGGSATGPGSASRAPADDPGMEQDSEQESAAQQGFHQISDHRGLQTACVACHTVHSRGEKPRFFMQPAAVHAQCQKCHRGGLGTEF